MPLTILPNNSPKKIKYSKSVINRTAWKDYTDPPIVPETYKSKIQPNIESQEFGPADFIIYSA